MEKKNWELPKILNPELIGLDRRIDKSCKWVEEHRDEIHPSISFIQAVELFDFGIDVTQIKPKQK